MRRRTECTWVTFAELYLYPLALNISAPFSQFGQFNNMMLVNGVVVDVTSPQFNVFNLYNIVLKELKLSDMINSLPFERSFLKSVRNNAAAHSAKVRMCLCVCLFVYVMTVPHPLFLRLLYPHLAPHCPQSIADDPRVDFREGAREGIFWINNIEKDERYKRLPGTRKIHGR